MPGTVTVACKIPNGLVLRVFVFEEHHEPVMAGGFKTVKRSRPTDWSQKINGPARAIGKDVSHQIIFGCGLTHGVDADKFALWLEQNKESDFVVKGLVFAQVKPNDAMSQASEHAKEKSGMEPVDPADMPPEFRRSIQPAQVTG